MKVKKYFDKKEGFEIPVDANKVYGFNTRFLGADVYMEIQTTKDNLEKLAYKNVVETREITKFTAEDIVYVSNKTNADEDLVDLIADIFETIGYEKFNSIVEAFNGK